MKVVINSCFGGFGLSHKGVMRYAKIKGIKLYPWIDDISKKVYGERATLDNKSICIHYSTIKVKDMDDWNKKCKEKPKGNFYWSVSDIKRNDNALIQTVKELGNKANGNCADLKIIEIPDGVEFEISEYDGNEHIAESHRKWS